MIYYVILMLSAILHVKCNAQNIQEHDINLRIEPGSKTCLYEVGRVGQMMEVYYQVLDGQHGDLDITLSVLDPMGTKIIEDYKKSQNSIIMDLEVDGDYTFCLDNTYSVMNSKLVFLYIVMEGKSGEVAEAEVTVVNEYGEEQTEVLEWVGTDADGQDYTLQVSDISSSLSRTLKQVVRARHYLDIYAATKSRDSYAAFQDTFIVDVWSTFQILFMASIGVLQVYMIKKLFVNKCEGYKGVL